jgi:hypothetical protein
MQFIFDIVVEFIIEVVFHGVIRFFEGAFRLIMRFFKVFKRKSRL